MPPKVKFHKNTGKSSIRPPKLPQPNPIEPSTSTNSLTPELEQQFEIELCWCIQQLQTALKSGKLNDKQVQDHTKSLNTLMSNSAPIIKKRQVMRLSFGDYRAKMAAEEKKQARGTKWCGAGNIADNDTDFGSQRGTDKCCRNHDYCPDIIEGGETKYNLTNPSFYTRLNCKCDEEFRKCLKSVRTKASTQVGQLYFTVLGTQCYKDEYPITGCNTYTYFPRKKCVDYSLDETEKKQYQWFDLTNF